MTQENDPAAADLTNEICVIAYRDQTPMVMQNPSDWASPSHHSFPVPIAPLSTAEIVRLLLCQNGPYTNTPVPLKSHAV
jgi:hypothetical protein